MHTYGVHPHTTNNHSPSLALYHAPFRRLLRKRRNLQRSPHLNA